MKNALIVALSVTALAATLAQTTNAQMSPAEITPRLAVTNQTTTSDTVVIPAVILARPGYVAVHGEKDGKVVITPALGVSKLLPAGLNRNVTIPLSGLVDGAQTVYPMVHFEGNGNQEYNFPGPDAPVTVDGKVLVAPMALTRVAAGTPGITVADGPITLTAKGAFVTIPSVTLAQSGFVALHSTGPDGKIKVLPVAGVSALLPAGTSTNVMVMLDPNVAVNPSDKLFAMAHVDANANGVYEFPATDAPVVSAGKVVVAPFTVR